MKKLKWLLMFLLLPSFAFASSVKIVNESNTNEGYHVQATIEMDETNSSTHTVIITSTGTSGVGVKGDKGDKGDPGINGTNGANGIDGTDGMNGANGTNGVDGHSPVVGMNGDQITVDGTVTGPHLTGSQGPQGIPGEDSGGGSIVYEATAPVTLGFGVSVTSITSIGDSLSLISSTSGREVARFMPGYAGASFLVRQQGDVADLPAIASIGDPTTGIAIAGPDAPRIAFALGGTQVFHFDHYGKFYGGRWLRDDYQPGIVEERDFDTGIFWHYENPWSIPLPSAQKALGFSIDNVPYLKTWSTRTWAPAFIADGSITSGGQFLAPNGTAAVPSYSFTTDTNTGIINGSDRLGMVSNGVETFRSRLGYQSGSEIMGTATNPSLYVGSPSVGFHLVPSNTLAIDTASTERMRIDDNGNVSIGTTTSGALFTVGGSSSTVNVAISGKTSVGTSVGTLTNAPCAGDPTTFVSVFIYIDDVKKEARIPAWVCE
jgi:hypothetical protein